MNRYNALIGCTLCLVLLTGCDAFKRNNVTTTRPATVTATAVDPPLPLHRQGTVGQYATLSGAMSVKVSGYGLVVGLGKRGCSNVPPPIENYLKTEMARAGVGFWYSGTEKLSPERVIRDKDTAAVLVGGMVPALAPAGTRFDLYVTAIPQTETTTLDGGHLMDTRLYLTLDDVAMPSGGIASVGRSDPKLGDVLVNPFLDAAKSEDQLKFRNGRIPNGGVVTEDMPVRLELRQPDWNRAIQIAAAVNTRFKGGYSEPPVAQARNNLVVEIHIPSRFHQDYVHFLELVLHLPLTKGSGVWEAQAKELVKAMETPGADCLNIALVLEAMDRQILPIVKTAYTSKSDAAAYYSAVTGMRLGDSTALQVITYHATKRDSKLRMTAIRELSRYRQELDARRTLEELLDDTSDQVRIAAYEGLVTLGYSSRIKQVPIVDAMGQQRFAMDLVETRGKYLVYSTQTGHPRLALFGPRMPVRKNLFFRMPPDSLVAIWEKPPMPPQNEPPVLGVNDPQAKATTFPTTMPMRSPEDVATTQPTTQPLRPRVIPKGPMLLVDRMVYRTDRRSEQYQVPADVQSLVQALGTPSDRDAYNQVRGLGLTYGQVIGVLYRLCKQGDVQAKFVLQDLPEMQRMLDSASTVERPDMPGQ